MKIKSLSMENFRQFEKETIHFAYDKENNITVIHGPNGSGKTTILNAFRWVLYGETNFDQGSDTLANEGSMASAKKGEEITVKVSLEFEHEDEDYRATRSIDFRKTDQDDFEGKEENPSLQVTYFDSSGNEVLKSNPKSALREILPPDLSRLFFFDGEYINELAGIDNQDEIQESIRNIMGLTILERSIRHLKDVEDEFQKEMQEYGSHELSNLIAKRKKLRGEIEDIEQKIKDQSSKRDRLLGDIQDIEAQLENIGESADIEGSRKQLRIERNKLEKEIEEIENQIREEVSEHGYLTFGMRAIEQTAEELDQLRAAGNIPSELSNSFVDQLLNEDKECICGRPLEEHSSHYESVQKYKSNVSSKKIDQTAFHIISNINHLMERRNSLFEEIQKLAKERKENEDRIEEINGEISDLTATLRDMKTSTKEHESPDQLEAKRKKLIEQREELASNSGALENQVSILQEELNSVNVDIEDAKEDESLAVTARRRWKATETVRIKIEKVYKELQDEVRKQSNDHIKETFDRIARKSNMVAEITEDFRLKIIQNVGGNDVEVNKSRGERQIASLSFIGSLAAIAREKYESAENTTYFAGGIYPIVMDSPFGTLDENHQRQVSKVIPELSDQIIVFVTDSQWSGPVEEEFEKLADLQYYLDFDEGESEGSYPHTNIKLESTSVPEGGARS